MKVCPIAFAVGCVKCPAFKVCPAKAALGGYREAPPVKAPAAESSAKPNG